MKNSSWSVSPAKAKFSELLSLASENPQIIQIRGSDVAVVLNTSDYLELSKFRVEPSGKDDLELCPARSDRELPFS